MAVFSFWKWFWGSRMGDAMDQSKSGKFNHYFDVLDAMAQTPVCYGSSQYVADWNLLGPIQLPRQEMGRVDAVAMDPINASVVYAGTPNSGLWRTNDISATDTVWDNITDDAPLPGLVVSDIVIDPSNSNIIFIATGLPMWGGYGLGVLKTTNGTSSSPTWKFTDLSYDPLSGQVVSVRKLLMRPSDPNVIYFAFGSATWDGTNNSKKKLWKTSDGGNNWTDVTNNLPVNYAGISGIAIDPTNPDRVWVSFNLIWGDGNPTPYNGTNRVYYSTDGGNTWANYSKGLTPLPINAIVYEKGSGDGVYVGTDVGIFYTNKHLYDADDPTNGNNTGWVCFNDGFPVSVVTELKINYATNSLRASTYGRGIWESNLACPSDLNLTESGTYASDEILEAQNNITSTATVSNGIDVTYRGGNEVVMQPSFHAQPGSDFHAFIHKCDGPGNSFKRRPKGSGTTDQEDNNEESQAIAPGVSLYPNPTNGLLRIQVPDEDLHANLELFDLNGRRLYAIENLDVNLVELDMSEYTPGIYLIVISTQSSRKAYKVVRQN